MFGGNQSKVSVVIGVTALVCAAVWIGMFVVAIVREVEIAHQASERLLSEADHREILAAGRQLLRQLQEANVGSRTFYVGDSPTSSQVPAFPEPILKLAPQSVRLNLHGYLVITMYASKGTYIGACVYPEDFNEPYDGFEYRGRMLVEGLWYYDN